MKQIPRVPKDYDGKEPPGRMLDSMLPEMLNQITKQFEESTVVIQKVWSEIVGLKVAELTRVTAYKRGVVFIQVKNATLMSILSSQEKARLMQNLKGKLPNIQFTNLVFQFG